MNRQTYMKTQEHEGNMIDNNKHFKFVSVDGKRQAHDLTHAELCIILNYPTSTLLKQIWWNIFERSGFNDILRSRIKGYSYESTRMSLMHAAYALFSYNQGVPIHIVYTIVYHLYKMELIESHYMRKVSEIETATLDATQRLYSVSNAVFTRLYRTTVLQTSEPFYEQGGSCYGFLRVYEELDGIVYNIITRCYCYIRADLYLGYLELKRKEAKRNMLKLSLYQSKLPVEILHNVADYFC